MPPRRSRPPSADAPSPTTQPSPNRTQETAPAPERPGKRVKYAPKACEQCRRRKLRCTGQRPCERCVNGDEHCSLLDEDPRDIGRRRNMLTLDKANSRRNPVELLLDRLDILEQTNLSIQRALVSSGISVELRQQQQHSSHAAPSDTSPSQPMDHPSWEVPGPSTMPSPEPDEYAAETALTHPVPQLGTILANELGTITVNTSPNQPRQPQPRLAPDSQGHDPGFAPGPPTEASPPTWISSQLKPPPGPTLSVRCGPVQCFLPVPARHDQYLDIFFTQVNSFAPCLNENDVRRRTSIVYDRAFGFGNASATADPILQFSLAPYLSLMMCIYACVDVLREQSASTAGYAWYRQAQELVGRRQITATGSDLTGVQVMILQSLFLWHRGNVDSAYAAIGRACRLCFQHGLNNAARWMTKTPFRIHMRQRVLWVTYCMDRRIALTCGRPYGMRWKDVAVGLPDALIDKNVYLDSPLPNPSPSSALQPYLSEHVQFANFAGRAWDTVSCPTVQSADRPEAIERLDAEIAEWIVTFDSGAELDEPKTVIQKQQRLVIRTLMLDLRILLRRNQILTSVFDERCGALCGELACAIVEPIHAASYEANWSLSPYLKTHSPTILFSSIIVLATLLIRSNTAPDILDMCRLRFNQAIEVISRLSPYLPAAAHVGSQLAEVVRLTNASLKMQDSRPPGVALLHDAASVLDFGDLFASEIQNLASNGGFPEAATATMDLWDSALTTSSAEGAGEEFSWDSLFAQLPGPSDALLW